MGYVSARGFSLNFFKHTNLYIHREQRLTEATNMPKTSKQRRGEIVHDLQQFGTNTISQRDFVKILEYNDVTTGAAIKDYTKRLLDGNYLGRVEGGFKLTKESRKEGIIIIKVRPSQHTAAVRDSLTAALQQFRPLTTMEIEG